MLLILKQKLLKLILLFFIAGVFFSSALFVWMEYDYETSVLKSIVEKATKSTPNKNMTQLVDTLLSYTNQIQYPNTNIMFDGDYNPFKKIITPPSFRNFYFGEGVCGSYAAFFARLMQHSGYKAYIVQMHTKTTKGAHMAVCILDSNKKYLVDPYFCHSFKDINNHLSDINDVAKRWNEYYKKNLPGTYPLIYDYQNGWRFTNWDKYGNLSRSLYNILSYAGVTHLDDFSFRYLIYGYNRYIAFVLGMISILLVSVGIKYYNKSLKL
jgi:hypothetical protein